ncbi:MAG: site-specific DNA-methyltransferase [Planctomycetota bacterium]
MTETADASVHLIVTSPPYWQLKDYGKSDQIGFDDTYEEYVNNLNLVWSECHRVLHKGCRLCVNIGDQFARSVYYGRYKVIPIRTEIIKFCETVGFDYMGAVIWQKVTTCNTTGGATIMGSFPHPRNGILKIDYEFILVFKKLGIPPKVSKTAKEQSRMTTEEWNQYFAGHWNFPGERQDGHLAMFPEELPRRLIKMFSFVGDTVLDPFLGSGTTCLAARNRGRNSVGYEINDEFVPIIEQKLGLGERTIFDEAEIEIVRQPAQRAEWGQAIRDLPYVFRDPIQFDKKVDPRKLRFGSRVDNSAAGHQEYHTVKEVLSPTMLVLDSGLKIRLLGIKERAAENGDAMRFLDEVAKGQKVFLRFDSTKHDADNNLLCYLYLKNKTFVNAHLIRRGLCDVDTSMEYKHRTRFESYRRNT